MKAFQEFGLQWIRAMTYPLVLGGLFMGWYMGYYWMLFVTEGLGVPWDTSVVLPPVGYWQRTLNDFFSAGVGAYLPAVIFLAVNIFLFVRAVIHTKNLRMSALVFGVVNLIAVVVWVVIASPIRDSMVIPAHLTVDDWAYWGDFRREWPLLGLTFGILVSLFSFLVYWGRRQGGGGGSVVGIPHTSQPVLYS